MIKKYLINLKYSGTNFFGWEKQLDVKTVQGELEKEISTFLDNENIHVQGSSRTDRYVHALDQYATFETSKDFITKKLVNHLNNINDDWKIKSIKLVDSNFQPRYDVKSKIYLYKALFKTSKPTIDQNQFWILNKKLSSQQIYFMKKLSTFLVGTKDFASFTSKEKYTNTIKTVSKIVIKRRNNHLYFYIYGEGFLRFQIRNIIGCLINTAISKISKREFFDLIKEPKIGKNVYKAPGQGLYLYRIKY